MLESAQVAPRKPAASFGDLLASFASKLQSDPWDDSALADDVTTLTYEQALRSTLQTRTPERGRDPSPGSLVHAGIMGEARERKSQPSVPEKKRKNASITIRLTSEEQAQLNERAMAAGLSVSAYLRSCIFEAESLRSQVKEALAQMQSIQVKASASTLKENHRNWKRRFFSAWRRGITET